MSENENPAETLRRAAALMRERAEAMAPTFVPMPHRVAIDRTGVCDACATSTRLVADYDDGWLCGECDAQAAYEGSWHPAVALAVADWLEESADHLEDQSAFPAEHVCPTAREGLECSVLGQALTVARAYLGTRP